LYGSWPTAISETAIAIVKITARICAIANLPSLESVDFAACH
jgi:hypothetical protein